ncbi:MAG: hypothetical protein RL199_2215, partial [Pseudomonadota bacterium]
MTPRIPVQFNIGNLSPTPFGPHRRAFGNAAAARSMPAAWLRFVATRSVTSPSSRHSSMLSFDVGESTTRAPGRSTMVVRTGNR